MSNGGIATSQDHKWKRRVDDLVIELTGWALTTAIGAIIGSLVTQQPVKQAFSDVRFWMFAGIVILLGGSVVHFVLKSIILKRQLAGLQEQDKVQERRLADLQEQDQVQGTWFTKFNIEHIYPGRKACDPIIQEKIKNSSKIKFFLLIGSDFAEDSGVYLPALREKPAGSAKVRILIANPESPFLSKERINNIRNDKEGDSREKMLAMLNLVEKHLVVLKKQMRERGILVEWRRHKETFLCKFQLFDDCAIFCFNIVTSDNDKISPYFVIQKDKELSIYNAFEMYFDFVWNKNWQKPR